MSSDNRRIITNSLILYVKLFITSAIGLFTSRIVLQSLGAADYGLYNVVGGIVVLVNILSSSLSATSYRYIAVAIGQKQEGAVNRVFNASLVLHGGVIVIAILFAETLGVYYVTQVMNVAADKIGDALFVLRLSTCAVVASILSIPFQGLLVALEKFVVLAIIEVSACILKLLVVIGLAVYTGNQLRFFSVLVAAIAVATAVAFMGYCRRTQDASVRWRFQRDVAAYKEMLGFSSWVLIGGVSCVARIQGAALIINAFFGMTINAAFALANSLNQIVLMFAQNLGQAAIPQITKSYSGGNTGRSMDIVSHISKYSFFLMLLPAVPILLETEYLLRLWLGEVPQYTEIFCKLVIINSLAECLGAGIPAMVAATGKIKWFQIILSGISLLSLPIAYACFKRGYPAYAILVVQIVIVLFNVVVRQVMLKKIIAFDVKRFLTTSYLRIAYVLLFVGPIFVVKDFFQDGFVRFLALSCGGVLWTMLAIYMVGTTKREKVIASNGVRNIIKRFGV